jgi:hypothetical protein
MGSIEQPISPNAIPIVDTKLMHQVIIAPNVFAGILVPKDGKKRHGWMHLRLADARIETKSKVVASTCEGGVQSTLLGPATLEVLNVVPKDHELLIRLSIEGGPIHFRVHTIVYK